ncbi:MAG: LLM class F420-dependent oxidoreductase [Gammaproteobacteria bacterium]
MSRLGYQIPNFTYPGVSSSNIFQNVVRQAQTAEQCGFDRLFVMDHFYQLPTLGEPDEAMLECYTLLGALAQHTSNVRLASLVTGNTYRNPALLAKIVTTLDHVSNGRATLGIGAGWFELEHQALGFPFGTWTERFEKLEEALNIIGPMLRNERPSLNGKHYQVKDAINSPPTVSRIPIMIGGGGEKKTLRMVAQYADESNLIGPVEDVPRKLEVLAAHCAKLGRDRAAIKVTKLLLVVIAPTMEAAYQDLKETALAKRWPTSKFDEIINGRSDFVIGDPDTVGETLNELAGYGLDGVTADLPANSHKPERIALLGETAAKYFPEVKPIS